ncbi:histone-lysine N-methyltransferase set-1-like [Astatotilapia calliptera]|uniref:histone-lysine N-methyltransferase set-1-like n=1 Tax=Astatotilapia calliptera TaxID=8154 RepID=UPI000E41392F|nr:histone-lysine N-methyltransferase set-1-like [Astatotilapia calliptera]
MRRRRIPPREDAVCHVSAGRDKLGLDIHYINAFKGRGIFTTVPFQKGDFLLEYRGKLITKEECERRHRVYHDSLKVFMFEFKFDGKLWCVDASQEDGSLGRLVNDNHISPSAKMKILNINGKPHLCLFASRDISPGEEIDYNYGDSDWLWRCKQCSRASSDINATASMDVKVTKCLLLSLYFSVQFRDHAVKFGRYFKHFRVSKMMAWIFTKEAHS